jgi:hypothetical protein
MFSVTSWRQRKILSRKGMFKHNCPNSLILKDDKIICNFFSATVLYQKVMGVVANHLYDFIFLFFFCVKN